MWPQFKRFPPSDLCMKLTLNSMQALHIKKCCFVFTPKQGTLLVAIVELSLTSIMLFLLLLAAMNTQEIVSVASAELQALEDAWSSDFGDKFGLNLYYTNNEKKMLSGQHLATIMMILTYAGVVLAIIHIMSCLMLLYGALHDISNFLLPWLSTVLLSIVISCLMLVTFVFFQHHKCAISFCLAATAVLGVKVYAWLTVFSYYREIPILKRLITDKKRYINSKNGVTQKQNV